MSDELIRENRGGTLWLTLNRSAVHNALNGAMTHALVEALADASHDTAIRVVVLTGAGEKSFCSGADLKEADGGMFRAEAGGNPVAKVLRAIETCEKLVIARINGSALAGGMGLVAACDLAYAVDTARFGLPEVRVGIFPMMVATRLLSQIPPRKLQEMAYLGDSISAAEAQAYGLINRSVPAAELDALLAATVDGLRKSAPAAITAGKKALLEMQDLAHSDMLGFAEWRIAELSDSEEAREGRAAFSEKRKPNWAG